MAKAKKHRIPPNKVFTSPGTLIYVGKENQGEVKVSLVQYNENEVLEKLQVEPNTLQVSKPNLISWVNVQGINDVKVMEKVGQHFHLHPLLLEDILNTNQRPKLEHFGENHISVILKALRWNDDANQIESNQLGLVLGQDFVVSFQESTGKNIFMPIVERVRASIGKTRKGKSDYLFYTLCDIAVDSYYLLLDDFSEMLENLEQRIIEHPQATDLQRLYTLRTELSFLRKSVMPLREVFLTLTREDSTLIKGGTDMYFRDLYDHVLQILDGIDFNREMIESIQNIYLNTINNKMNAVMKTLTVFTAIFMPLSFLASIYGMNFENMPELKNPNGYYFTLGGMALVGVSLWAYFRWKKYT